ncbi:MAG: threonine-phosphate decarboxylase CobD [bacterium]
MEITYSPFSHGGNIYRFGKDVIDFSANINPCGFSSQVKKTIYKNLDKIIHYPDTEAKITTQKIARFWQIKEDNILVGNGSVELIYLIALTYKPKTAIIPQPTFCEYERALKTVNSNIRFDQLQEKEGFRLNLSSLSEAEILFVCNPNNPTGNLVLKNRQQIEKLTINKLVVVDESFMDFLADEKKHTLIYEAVKSRQIIVLRTFTKFFGIPGLRIGYLVAHPETVSTLKEYQMPWNTNLLAQLATEVILDDSAFIKKTYQLIEKEREFLFNELTKIKGLFPYPSVTNFLLIRIEKDSVTSSNLVNDLIKKGILVRDCSNFRYLDNKYIRCAIREHKDNIKLIEALKEIFPNEV